MIHVVSALCGPMTRVYAVSPSVTQSGWRLASGKNYANPDDSCRIQLPINYEPGVTLGNFQSDPLIQKFHTLPEYVELF